MAMNGNDLGSKIAEEIEKLDLDSSPPPTPEEIWKIVANEIINHIKNNAEVSTNVTTTVAAGIAVQVAPATGTGATAAPGSGSGSGTGTVS